MLENKKKIILGVSFLIIFIIGFFAGSTIGIRNYITTEGGEVKIERVLDLYQKSRDPEVSFNQFWEVWNRVKDKHVGQPLDDVKLFYGAIAGMVQGIEDPYSVYMPPQEAEEFAKDLAGEFGGIGAEIGIRDGQLQVIAPLPSTPAEKAGLKPGDKIFAIDGEETFNMTSDQAVMKIRGKEGTEVVLTISHDGFEAIEEVKIIRDKINVPTVDWEMKEENIVYLRVSFFNETTWDEFDKAVKEITAKDPSGIILDLRSNPGGFLQTSVDVASEWIESGLVVKERDSTGEEKLYRTHGKHRFNNIKTVVLVDEGTASGSEIVAGALQDHSIAKLVGMQTFGKGSVQDFEAFTDGSALKLTIAKWYTPNDRQIDEEGITPDVILEKMFEVPEGEEINLEDVRDLGLKKAMEILKTED